MERRLYSVLVTHHGGSVAFHGRPTAAKFKKRTRTSHRDRMRLRERRCTKEIPKRRRALDVKGYRKEMGLGTVQETGGWIRRGERKLGSLSPPSPPHTLRTLAHPTVLSE